MSAFELVALVGALAGLCMVLGGIWLVAKGVITLAATPHAEALTIEWKKQFRINTQVPGLAFFMVGLMFIAVSLQYLKPPELSPIAIEGQLKGVDEQISISLRPQQPWALTPDTTTGQITGSINPDLSFLVMSINAPGYVPLSKSIKVNLQGSRIAKFGTVELQRSKVKENDLSKQQIAPLPFTPPESQAASSAGFGGPL